MDFPSIRYQASNKIYQLKMAKLCHLQIPTTIITNDITTINEFCTYHKVIYKTLFKPIIDFDKGTSIINTTIINKTMLQEMIETSETSPCLLQEYIEKKYELRIHIIGKKIIAVKINSQDVPEAKIDWRIANFNKLTYSKYTLPSKLEKQLLKFMAMLKLNFGIIDMIVTPKQEYVFLEINPNGNWWWIESATKLPISQSII